MKTLAVRVLKAVIRAEEEEFSSIGPGLVVFVGMEKDDDDTVLTRMAEKIVNLRIFENEEGKMHYSLKDKGLPLLCISNFTLCADTGGGRRPSFDAAMPPEQANEAFKNLVAILAAAGIEVKQGIFGRHMDIDLTMDGPVNILLEIKS